MLPDEPWHLLSPKFTRGLWEIVLDANNLLSDRLEEKIRELISQCLTLPTDFSEDARTRFASLIPEPEVDDPGKDPSFCLTASDLAREVHRLLFLCVTPSLSGTPSQLAIQEWAHSGTPSAKSQVPFSALLRLPPGPEVLKAGKGPPLLEGMT